MPRPTARRGVEQAFEYVEGWGMAVGTHARVLRPRSIEELIQCFALARSEGASLGLRGGGISYGDASLTSRGHTLDCSRLQRVLEFDASTGVAVLEPGVTIEQLWKHILPHGYWPRVVSGTMFPTVGGAAAMNIHGKNNYAVGTLGDAILEFDLLLTSGEIRRCSRTQNSELFHAAIGGLGMLGVFTRIVLETKRVYSGDLRVRAATAPNLRSMMEIMEARRGDSDYLVGWIDCFGRGRGLGRGLIHLANYLAPGEDPHPERTLTVEHQELPANILGVFPKSEVWRALSLFGNDPGMRLINRAKYQSGRLEARGKAHLQSHAGFAFLLDYVPNWKWAYGRERGRRAMIQYQTFVPHAAAEGVFTELLERCHRARLVPYLGVFKRHRPDPFWLTHAVDGWSFAMDMKVSPENRERLWKHCAEMTEVVLRAGGRFYFAKDLVLRAGDPERFYPPDRLARFRQLKRELDPESLLETDLWRRAFAPAADRPA
ncbi:MAG: FAD-binding oxidoreductase [Planctomycetes bacterium]|nr:FAD-binding oxidoreductase [Planctomycetota bacterium]